MSRKTTHDVHWFKPDKNLFVKGNPRAIMGSTVNVMNKIYYLEGNPTIAQAAEEFGKIWVLGEEPKKILDKYIALGFGDVPVRTIFENHWVKSS